MIREINFLIIFLYSFKMLKSELKTNVKLKIDIKTYNINIIYYNKRKLK